MRSFKLADINETPGRMGHYSIHSFDNRDNSAIEAMTFLKEIFTNSPIDDLNLVFVGTSGVHGSYAKPWEKDVIKDLKKDGYYDITFVYLQPRTIQMFFGNARCESIKDLKFLTKLACETSKVLKKVTK